MTGWMLRATLRIQGPMGWHASYCLGVGRLVNRHRAALLLAHRGCGFVYFLLIGWFVLEGDHRASVVRHS